MNADPAVLLAGSLASYGVCLSSPVSFVTNIFIAVYLTNTRALFPVTLPPPVPSSSHVHPSSLSAVPAAVSAKGHNAGEVRSTRQAMS
jgi:hypothetical protein